MYLVEVPLGGDGRDVIKVEIRHADEGLVPVARPGQVIARASESLGSMLTAMRSVAETFVDTFQGLANAPDEIAVQFGIALNAEADAIITSTSAEANFSVSLVWKR